MATIGIFSGSFNPVHNGHIRLAQAVADSGAVDSVWLTLSPANPLKEHPEELISDADRWAMLQLAVEGHPALHACDVELSMPRPSYTIDTLTKLSHDFPQHKFRLMIGADNMLIFDKWKNHDEILARFSPIVYPRPGYECEVCDNSLPTFDVSSTEIRRAIAAGLPANNLLPEKVYNYILSHNLYK